MVDLELLIKMMIHRSTRRQKQHTHTHKPTKKPNKPIVKKRRISYFLGFNFSLSGSQLLLVPPFRGGREKERRAVKTSGPSPALGVNRARVPVLW